MRDLRRSGEVEVLRGAAHRPQHVAGHGVDLGQRDLRRPPAAGRAGLSWPSSSDQNRRSTAPARARAGVRAVPHRADRRAALLQEGRRIAGHHQLTARDIQRALKPRRLHRPRLLSRRPAPRRRGRHRPVGVPERRRLVRYSYRSIVAATWTICSWPDGAYRSPTRPWDRPHIPGVGGAGTGRGHRCGSLCAPEIRRRPAGDGSTYRTTETRSSRQRAQPCRVRHLRHQARPSNGTRGAGTPASGQLPRDYVPHRAASRDARPGDERVLAGRGPRPADHAQRRQTLGHITSAVLNGIDPAGGGEADIMLVHGDTTTTFAAALAAFYIG